MISTNIREKYYKDKTRVKWKRLDKEKYNRKNKSKKKILQEKIEQERRNEEYKRESEIKEFLNKAFSSSTVPQIPDDILPSPTSMGMDAFLQAMKNQPPPRSTIPPVSMARPVRNQVNVSHQGMNSREYSNFKNR